MTGRKSMEVLRNKANKLNEKVSKLKVRADKARAMMEKYESQLHELEDKMHPMMQMIAGINGHLANEEFGATQYETFRTPDGWSAIKFYNDAGDEVKNPAVVAMIRRLQDEDQKKAV